MSDRLSTFRREFLLTVGAGVIWCAPAFGQTFVDKSAELGVSGGNEACWFDMNNDGWVDLCAGGKVYVNRRGIQFVHVADTGAVVAADYDNDGWTDLYSWSGRTVYRNNEGQSFTAVPMPDLPTGSSLGATWADLNGDGYVDLYVGGYEAWPNDTYADYILLNRRGIAFAVSWSEVRFRARGVTSCDYDRDGDMDIYVSNYRLQPNVLWQNQGDFSFLDKTAEYNALATDRGFGGGHSIGSCWGDFDDDGHIDLFAGNFAHNDGRGHQPESHCLKNRGPDGNFQFEDLGQRGVFYQESYSSPAAGDYDNDGDLDLFFTTVYGVASFGVPNNPVLYRNDGSFNFGNATGEAQLGGLPATYQAAWADFDNDGDLDLMAAGSLFENQGGTGNSWLKVRLVGDGSNVNRSAIGGQVRIALPGGRILTRHVEAGTGQGNANDLTLHFGLGTQRDPVELEVFWPDGTTQRIAGVAVDQQITLNREPLVEIVKPVEDVALEAGAGLLFQGRAAEPGVTLLWSAEPPEGGRVSIGQPEELETTMGFSIPGRYLVRLTGEKGGITSSEMVAVTVWEDESPGGDLMEAPLIDFPGDRITVPGVTFPLAKFEPSIGDGSLLRWEHESGPAAPEFSDPAQRDGTVAFPAPGDYTLLLFAENQFAITFREITVEHTGGAEGAPASFGIDDLDLPQTAADHVIELYPVFQDPDDDDASLVFSVSIDAGGEDSLERAEVVDGRLVLRAARDREGVALVVVQARDPAGHTSESVFAVSVSNSPPQVEEATWTLQENAPVGEPAGRVVASDLDQDRLRFHIVAGNHRNAFAIDPRTGEIRVHNSEVIDFESVPQFDLQVAVTDSKHSAFDRPVAVTIVIGDLSEDPRLEDARFVVKDDAPAGAVVGSLAGGDPDGEPLTYAITGGDAGEVFSIDPASGEITLADPAGLAGQRRFDLRVSGTDLSGATGEADVIVLPARALIPEGAAVKWLVPTDDSQDAGWRGLNHDESGWAEGLMALGYDTGPEYEAFIATDIDAEMRGQNTTIYARHRFTVADPQQLGPVILRMRYDDGFLAYLNGELVAARLAPEDADWQSGAVSGHADSEAMVLENFDIGLAEGVLVAGDNILVIHGLNHLLTSSDYLLSAELLAAAPQPGVALLPEGAGVRWKVPSDGSEDEEWTEATFDDSTWTADSMALGYDANPDYLPHIATDVTAEMQGINTGIYLRARFDVPDPAAYSRLWLEMKYDDGFVAYLNGLYAEAANQPPLVDLGWQSGATLGHDDAEALEFQRFDLGLPGRWLRPGENVLTLHGLNYGLTSSDFILSARVVGDPLVLPPGGPVAIYPSAVTGITRTKAVVQGEVAALGGAPAHLFAVWGQRDYGPDPNRWPGRVYVGFVEEPGPYSGRLHGLHAGRDYVVRIYAQRADGGVIDGWSSPTGFSTANHPATSLVAGESPVQALVPLSGNEDPDWREANFSADPARWVTGTSPAGFDRLKVFADTLGLDLLHSMFGVNASAYLRFPFVLGDPVGLETLTLRMKYDDGFVAYLNGIEIARGNAPAALDWNQAAPQSRPDPEVDTFVEFDVSPYRGVLRAGPNVLAIHGLNRAANDADFLVAPELTATGAAGALNVFDSWAFESGYFGGDAHPQSDSDRNGRTAFEEFAGVELVEFRPGSGGFGPTLRYRRRAGLLYEVQISENLVDWQTVTPLAESADLLAGGELELATVQIAAAAGASERAFVRIVSRLPADGLRTPRVILLDAQSIARALVPDGPAPGWTRAAFDDRLWASGPLAVGYEAGSGYENLIGLDLRAPMQGNNTSAFVRVPFVLADPSTLESLTLRMKYDDGFVAYLNGVRVASANTDPSNPLTWRSGTPAAQDDSLAVQFEDFDLTGYLAALVPGRNVLAIHGLNAGLGSSDLLILPELVATGGSQEVSAYDRWTLGHGLSGATARRDADPDRDGTDNFGEFAVAGNPMRHDRERTALRVSPVDGGAFLDVTIRRRLGAVQDGLTLELERSSDLVSWVPADGVEHEVRPSPDGLAELVTVRLPASGERGFVRLVAR